MIRADFKEAPIHGVQLNVKEFGLNFFNTQRQDISEYLLRDSKRMFFNVLLEVLCLYVDKIPFFKCLCNCNYEINVMKL